MTSKVASQLTAGQEREAETGAKEGLHVHGFLREGSILRKDIDVLPRRHIWRLNECCMLHMEEL